MGKTKKGTIEQSGARKGTWMKRGFNTCQTYGWKGWGLWLEGLKEKGIF